MRAVPYDAWKRVIDVAGASAALLLFSPLMLGAALLVHHRLGSPVLFRQIRAGRNGEPFQCLKFRSMTDQRESDGAMLPDEVRLTPFGKLLRRTSIDELPQLINVLNGDMSLVGPRPLLMEYVPLYTPEQAQRLDVRPGMTGHSQVNGRSSIAWDEKLQMDSWYVANRSLALDLRILWKSVGTVIRGSDLSVPGTVTMPRFEGSAKASDSDKSIRDRLTPPA